jgi:hypothetical protein
MPINSSGPIYLGRGDTGQGIADEIGQSISAITVNDSYVRFLAQITTSETAISFSDFLGKSKFIDISSNNWLNNYYIAGIDSGGGGPTEQGGTYGGVLSIGYCIFLKNYIASNGSQWTPARDMAFIHPSTVLSYSDCATLLLEKSDVRSINGSKTINWTVDVDNWWYYGYWDITLSATPVLADIGNGSWQQQGSTYQPGGGRQRGLGFSFTLPQPPINHIYVPACYSDRGSSNHYLTIS